MKAKQEKREAVKAIALDIINHDLDKLRSDLSRYKSKLRVNDNIAFDEKEYDCRLLDIALEVGDIESMEILFKYGASSNNPRCIIDVRGSAKDAVLALSRALKRLDHEAINKMISLYCRRKHCEKYRLCDVSYYTSQFALGVADAVKNKNILEEEGIDFSEENIDAISTFMEKKKNEAKPGCYSNLRWHCCSIF